ncbi:photosystem I subunit O [Cucumis melo var. makuwa]|nr:photosystem I subunit O [Cucumis melo var. makuwa]TYK30980.1 photosystem I subunit O [Cucumis melo var. makuwa]
MATAFATSSVAGLGTASLSSPSSRSPRLVSGNPLLPPINPSPTLSATAVIYFLVFIVVFAGFIKSPVAARNPLNVGRASRGRFTCFERDWLRRDLNVIGFGLIGWIAPSSIPVINGKSLTGLFFESIGTELAHFPSPPALTSQFW